VDYAEYLQLDRLLSLQRRVSPGPEHDEMLFIVVHQVYELWFKQILHEIDHLQACLEKGEQPRAEHALRRILTILKTLVAQLDVLETMTPLGFASFRDRLEAGSGLQSRQFREIELALGQRRRAALERFAPGSEDRRRLERRWNAPSLWDAFVRHLVRRGHAVPRSVLERDVREPIVPDAELQRVLIGVYRRDLEGARLCERLVDLDEGLQEWRYRHVKMVERTIGSKTGTGGSSGAAYLRGTLFQPAFPDLWLIRTEL
jgi:tryptophan 2,3-dioxygenase